MRSDIDNDPMLALLRELRTYDASPTRVQRLRARCHSGLQTNDSSRQSSQSNKAGAWARAVGMLAGAWCVVYLLETIREAAAAFGF